MALNAEQIRKNVRELAKSLKKTHKRSNPGEIHALRTRARQFETTVGALSLDSKRNERWLMKRLGRIRKRAGEVRDLDVLTSNLATLHLKEETNCLVQLFEYLGTERYKHAGRLVRLVEKDRSAIRKRLKKTSSRIERMLGANEQASSQSKAVANAIASAMELASELATPANLNRGNMHEYRLKVKELRDVLQISNDASHLKFVESLGKVKDAIGEWHDWEELIAISTKLLSHGPSCRLLHEFRVISSRKYESALSITNKMRKVCLKSANLNARGSGGDKDKAGQPVIKAVSTIAA